MTLYLLNHFSTVGLVLLIVGGTTALSIVVTIVVHRLFPNLADSRFEELIGIMRADVFALLGKFWVFDSPPRPLASETFEKVAAQDLIGVWSSDNSFGGAVFGEVDGEIRAAYRGNKGTVDGALSTDGVFRGWWCAEGSRTPPKDAGEIEWRLLKTPDGERKKLDGRWRYGTEESWRGGWNLSKLDARSEPPDLAAMFDEPSSFCRHP
jgi:hypothetical protein